MTAQNANPLGTESISKLLLRYAIPSIVSMLVMSLYNIVDQIFIGWGVGYLGNTATTVAFPLTTLAQGLALMIGNGGAAFMNLEMGRGNHDKPRKILGNAVTVLTAVSLVYATAVLLFLRPILTGLGATDTVMPYAVDYTWVIMLGMPFNIIGNGLSNIIRADGSPRYAMASTLAGAALNTILDPIFIFVFGMGVMGAAIATVISQVVSWSIVILYFARYARHTRLTAAGLRPQGALIAKIAALGSSNFITHSAITVVNVVLNNSLRIYGAASPYGSEIPIAAQGIIMKINSILLAVILGVAAGAQPLLGFNYGAGNYTRVRRTYQTAVSITLSLSLACSLLFHFAPEPFIAIFGNRDPAFTEYACRAMSIYLSCVFAIGIQIPSAHYFQAVGKPVKAITLATTRQLLILVPMILILPRFFGLDGVLYAGPAGDICAAVFTSAFVFREIRALGRIEDVDGAASVNRL